MAQRRGAETSALLGCDWLHERSPSVFRGRAWLVIEPITITKEARWFRLRFALRPGPHPRVDTQLTEIAGTGEEERPLSGL
jgi:hypothetical protein